MTTEYDIVIIGAGGGALPRPSKHTGTVPK